MVPYPPGQRPLRQLPRRQVLDHGHDLGLGRFQLVCVDPKRDVNGHQRDPLVAVREPVVPGEPEAVRGGKISDVWGVGVRREGSDLDS